MSRLLIITHPTLVAGFQLAGVDAFGAADAAAAQQLVARWLETGETGLLAIDEELLAGFDPSLLQRLAAADGRNSGSSQKPVSSLPYLALPRGRQAESGSAGRQRIAEWLRQTIGFHITLHDERV